MGSSAGRLGFAIVGGVIGAFFGFPQLGFLAGSLIGGLIFPVEGPTIEGPRLDDLSVSSSANGNPIGMGGGTMRMPAEIIDATEIEEERREEDVGGKGGMGGGGTQVTYRYYANLFLSFGEPLQRSIKGGKAVAITEFFADGKKVFDNSPVFLDITDAVLAGVTMKGGIGTDGFNYRFYNGGETQLPDPFFENLRGVGNVPGYRGQVCIAIERWPLEDYGNRIPVMTAVIAYDGTIANEVRDETSLPARSGSDTFMGVNFDFQRLYTNNTIDGGPQVSEIELGSLTELRRGQKLDVFGREGLGDSLSVSSLYVAPLTGLMVAEAGGVGPGFGTNAEAVISIDPLTLESNGRLGKAGAFNGNVPPTISDPFGNIKAIGFGAINTLVGLEGEFESYFMLAQQDDIFLCRVLPSPLTNAQTPQTGALEWVWGGGATTGVGKRDASGFDEASFTAQCRGRILLGKCEFIAVTGHSSTWPAAVYKITVFTGSSYKISTTTFPGILVSVIVPDLNFTNGSADFVSDILFDDTDQTHILFINEIPTSGAAMRLVKIDSDGNTIWDTGTLPDDIGPPSGSLDSRRKAAFTQSRIANNFVCLRGENLSGETLYTLNTVTGEVSDVQQNVPLLTDVTAIDTITGSLIQSTGAGVQQFFCGRVNGEGITLGEINRNVADRAGYETAVTTDVDFNALDTVTIPGIGIKRQMQAVAAVRGLMPAYAYEIVEVDHKIKGIFLDKASALTIDADTLLPQGQEIRQLLLEERTDDQQIPARVNVVYADPALDYESGNQPAKRIRDPRPTTRSISEKSVQLPVAETATKAYEIAEQMLWRAYVERRKLLFNTDWEFLRLSGSDVITITSNGDTFVVRIIEMIVGKDFTIRFKSVSHESPVFLPSDESANTDGGTHLPQTINPSAVSSLSFLDAAPMLRDSDNSTTVVPVYYGCFATPDFNNSTIYKRDPSGAWHDIDRCVREIVRGFAHEPLDAPVRGAFFTDEDSQFEFQIVEGSTDRITSQTAQEFRDNGLAFLVGSEVISVRDIVQLTDGSFVGTGLHRGLLGTEEFISTHVDSESVFLLDSSALMILTEPIGEIGVLSSYKAVNDNQSFDLAPVVQHAPSSTPLLPFAVAQMSATNEVNDDITIDGNPRSRLTSNLRDGLDAYNESETTESYSLEIVSGGATVRTIAGASLPLTYTAAQQTTDLGGLAQTITLNLYKVSTLVGNGRLASISHDGPGGASGGGAAAAPTVTGTGTTANGESPTSGNITFNHTPASGSGTTMLVVVVAHNEISAAAEDDIRFLDMQGNSFVRFGGVDLTHIDQFSQRDDGSWTGVADVFYMVAPGTTEQEIEIQWPDATTPRAYVVHAFTVQDVNPTAPFASVDSVNAADGLSDATPTAAPSWPNASSADYGSFEFDGKVTGTWRKRASSGDSLGLWFECVEDNRTNQNTTPTPDLTLVAEATANGLTSGNTNICSLRLFSRPLVGDVDSQHKSAYSQEAFEVTQPRQTAAMMLEVQGI